ncbi:hypothetical protein WICPIJ_004418 [Wickerhamomyces pijperi]|uniref:Uncharacterized protein n=1 Tax=Wickerhamomyces pijperi TaxID=599730 RepID=A0A9P8Q5N8_WICPI|nr:hypothetical protein WICPIJ_004418 [Wickerhamomyces pijperi]
MRSVFVKVEVSSVLVELIIWRKIGEDDVLQLWTIDDLTDVMIHNVNSLQVSQFSQIQHGFILASFESLSTSDTVVTVACWLDRKDHQFRNHRKVDFIQSFL